MRTCLRLSGAGWCRFCGLSKSCLAESEAAKAEGQFKKGNKAGPNGRKGKEPVRTDSYEPVPEPERDYKFENARSTVGKLFIKREVENVTKPSESEDDVTIPDHITGNEKHPQAPGFAGVSR